MEKINVIKIGGSLFFSNMVFQKSLISQVVSVIEHSASQNNKFIIVIGGGEIAKLYSNGARELGANNGIRDMLGIQVSRINCRLFIEAFQNKSLVWPTPAESLEDVRKLIRQFQVVVVGGFQPGQSTTAVAALCGEYCDVKRIIYCTDVDGVYEEDPRKNPDAKILDRCCYDKLRELTINKKNMMPGNYCLMDSMALTILERSQMNGLILKGTPENIEKVLQGKEVGTIIKTLF